MTTPSPSIEGRGCMGTELMFVRSGRDPVLLLIGIEGRSISGEGTILDCEGQEGLVQEFEDEEQIAKVSIAN